MTPAQYFLTACSSLAAKYNVQRVVIAVVDHTGQVLCVASPGAVDVTRAKVAEVYKLGDLEAAQARIKQLETEIASMGGETGWEA